MNGAGLTQGSRRASLHIARRGEEYTFTLFDHDRFPLAFEVLIKTPDTARKEILEVYQYLFEHTSGRMRSPTSAVSQATQPAISELQLVRDLGDLVTESVPREILRSLTDLQPESLLLTTNDPCVPWELMMLGERFLIETTAIGKCVRTAVPLGRPRSRPRETRVRVLVISNPTGDLTGADEEARALRDLFDRDPRFIAAYLERGQATLSNLARLLRKQTFDVLHYAGHTQGDPADDDGATFFLSDTVVTASYLANILSERVPQLLFLNSCGSAQINSVGGTHNYVEGIFPPFLHAGVGAAVGAMWPVVDSAAISIATTFYQHLGRGFSIGESLRKARFDKRDAQSDAATWAGYTLVGDPDLLVVRPSDQRTELWTSDGYMSATAVFAGRSELSVGGFEPLLIAAQTQGISIVGIAAQHRNWAGLVTRRSDSTVASLRGRRIGVSPNTGMHAFLLALLAREDILPSDVDLTFVDNRSLLSALEKDKVDAAVLYEPWVSLCRSKGYRILGDEDWNEQVSVSGLVAARTSSGGWSDATLVAIRRYFRCAQLIEDGMFDVVGLLEPTFGLPREIIQQAMKSITFCTQEAQACIGEQMRERVGDRAALLHRQGLLDAPDVHDSFWCMASPEDVRLANDTGHPPVPVTVQPSVSAAPFLLGKFLGLFC